MRNSKAKYLKTENSSVFKKVIYYDKIIWLQQKSDFNINMSINLFAHMHKSI